MTQESRPEAVPLPSAWADPWRAEPAIPRSIVELLADSVLDTELAALLWLLVEARLPVVVAGPFGAGRTTLLTALLDFLPADARPVPLAGAEEDFDWLPEAPELGWRRERTGAPRERTGPARGRGAAASPGNTVLMVRELGGRPPAGTWGPRARIVIRALAVGYGMAATMIGGGLEDVFAALHAAPVGADDDELARLGLVLVVNAFPAETAGREPRRRVVAVHYVRPVVRDAHGHVQRLPPAVLAAHEPRTDRLEHFAWGIVGELAGRTGRPAIDFEREQAQRAGYLAGLVAGGISEPDAVRAAIAGYRGTEGGRPA